jgi:hypothetical protein
MAGLDPAIHVFVTKNRKQDVDHRDKPGDDVEFVAGVSAAPMRAADASMFIWPEKVLAPPAQAAKVSNGCFW